MAGRVETTAGSLTSCALAGAQFMKTTIHNNRKAGRSRRTIKFISTPPISNSVGGRDYCEPICCTNCREEYNKWVGIAMELLRVGCALPSDRSYKSYRTYCSSLNL